MKCIVIDDEPVAIDILTDYIGKVDELELVCAYRSALEALNQMKNQPVDLLFLDVNMPDLSGIQFLDSLDQQPMVIFTTAYSEYAVKSYDYKAIDYLLKPIEFERFLKAVGKASAQLKEAAASSGSEEAILVKSGTRLHRLQVEDILFIKGTGNYVTFVVKDREIMTQQVVTKQKISILCKRIELLQDRF